MEGIHNNPNKDILDGDYSYSRRSVPQTADPLRVISELISMKIIWGVGIQGMKRFFCKMNFSLDGLE